MKNVLTATDRLLPLTAKNLLNELRTREITLPEFNKECAKWGMGYLDAYAYIPMPDPPYEVVQYARRKQKDPDYSLSQEFWNKPEIKAWSREEAKTLGLNKSNYEWLRFMSKQIADPNEKLRIAGMIREFDKNKRWVFGKDMIDALAA